MASLNTISTQRKKHRCLELKRKIAKNGMITRFRRLTIEMEEISIEQEHIKEEQRQVRVKFEEIEGECDQLRKETKQMIQQSAKTQIRLAFMFNILKARQAGEFAKASQLTQLLRDMIAQE